MNIITHNPFRILGLIGNSSERELQKQLSKIKASERVGKKVFLVYDFKVIGGFTRNAEYIQQCIN